MPIDNFIIAPILFYIVILNYYTNNNFNNFQLYQQTNLCKILTKNIYSNNNLTQYDKQKILLDYLLFQHYEFKKNVGSTFLTDDEVNELFPKFVADSSIVDTIYKNNNC